jgi:hypothetical protein
MSEPVEGPARRGRRNPEVAARIAAGRAAEAAAAANPLVTGAEETALAEFISDEYQTSEGELEAGEYPLLYPGDTVFAKATHTAVIGNQESWFTYAATSRIQNGEEEQDAFARVCTVVNGRSLDMIYDAEERVAEETARRQQLAAEQYAMQQAAAQAAAYPQQPPYATPNSPQGPPVPNRIQPRRR